MAVRVKLFKIIAIGVLLCCTGAVKCAEANRNDFRGYLQGRHVFGSQCAPCHGSRGRGDGPWSEGMTVLPRNFRMGIFKYRSTPMGFLPTDDDLRRTIKKGVSGTAMPTFGKSLSESDITAVIVYLKNLSHRWEDLGRKTNGMILPEEPSWFAESENYKKHLARGRDTYRQICVNCHGESGKGDGPGSKGLTNVWSHVVAPANLALPHLRSGSTRQDFFRTISMGLDGTPMIGFGSVFRDEQIWELIAVVESLKKSDRK